MKLALRILLMIVVVLCPFCKTWAGEYFIVRVVDEETRRGVPLICLKLPNEVEYWTDSAGVAALKEPSFAECKTFIEIRSDGYEYPDETFFGRGVILKIEPGKTPN